MTGNGSDEVRLNDVEPGMQHDVEDALVMRLVGDGLHQLLPGLLVHQGPEAVLAVLQKGWQRYNDPDASLRVRQIDGGRLLHLLCIWQNGKQRGALMRDAGMSLDSQFLNQRTVDSWTRRQQATSTGTRKTNGAYLYRQAGIFSGQHSHCPEGWFGMAEMEPRE